MGKLVEEEAIPSQGLQKESGLSWGHFGDSYKPPQEDVSKTISTVTTPTTTDVKTNMSQLADTKTNIFFLCKGK